MVNYFKVRATLGMVGNDNYAGQRFLYLPGSYGYGQIMIIMVRVVSLDRTLEMPSLVHGRLLRVIRMLSGKQPSSRIMVLTLTFSMTI